MSDRNVESVWDERRRRVCLAADVTNLNAGTCSPTSCAAFEATLALARQQAYDPVEFVFRRAPRLLAATRAALARAADCEPQDLLLFTNATFGINTAVHSLALAPGDEVLTTDQEYHHYEPLWDELLARTGARRVVVHLPLASERADVTPEDLVECFARAITPKTKVLHFSHVTSRTGLALPANELCALARAHGAISLVDGAHALGLVSVSLAAMQPDFYAANAHKWLMSTPGAAMLYTAPARRAGLVPLVTTGYSVFDAAAAEESVGNGGPARWQYAHEYQGTRDLVPLLVVPEAVAFHAELGLADLTARSRELAALCRRRLAELGFRAVSPTHRALATCMTAFLVPEPGGRRINGTKAWNHLRRQHGIEVTFPSLADGRVVLRVSTAWFNVAEDVERLTAVLRELEWSELI